MSENLFTITPIQCSSSPVTAVHDPLEAPFTIERRPQSICSRTVFCMRFASILCFITPDHHGFFSLLSRLQTATKSVGTSDKYVIPSTLSFLDNPTWGNRFAYPARFCEFQTQNGKNRRKRVVSLALYRATTLSHGGAKCSP
jgi:hypothetical protein